MFYRKFGGISALIIFLILFSPLISLAQNEGDFDPAEGLDFEVVKSYIGDVLDIKIADIDGDNNADIIYGGMMQHYLHIMYGQENGGFEAPEIYLAGAKVLSIAYINNDNLPDIIGSFMYNQYICINNGDRTFTIDSLTHEYTDLAGIATGFFNDDSYLDIIGGNQYIYYGDGEGNFPVIDTLSYEFQSVFVSDFNNDGIDDFIAIDNRGRSDIYLNDNDGNFTKSANFALGGLTLGVSIDNPFADFNRDGNADFAFITPMGINPSPVKLQSDMAMAMEASQIFPIK